MTQIMELFCGKRLNHAQLPYILSKYTFCKMFLCLFLTQYLNIPNFRPEKGGFGPLRAKGPEMGVVITNL